ncbi:MAG: prepilin peptidase [Lachnospiraceae bacterium]
MSIYENTMMMTYFCVLAAILGAVMGSFLNCAAWRIAHGESVKEGRSHCPDCGHTLGIPDLVPVFSWLFLHGKCRYCGHKISVRYPISEVLMAVFMVLTLLRFDLSVMCLRNMIFFFCLFCLSLVDLENRIIPDGCLIISVVVWIAAIPFAFGEYGGWNGIFLNLLSAVVYGGGMLLLSLLMDHILRKESLGGGDIKLFAVMGLYLGLVASLFALLFACLFGLVLAVGLAKRSSKFNGVIPFGPAIAAATWTMLTYGSGLVNWYTGLL